jgi:predicted nucleic acid-binding protein
MNVAILRGRFFLDTNVLVYSFDPESADKQHRAQTLIHEALRSQRGVISTQVVQEFLSLALRKFARPMSVTEARDYLRSALAPLCQHFPTISFYDRALLIQEETGFSFYEALIMAAAVEAGCSTLLSEDLQHGRTVQGVTIVNPFLDA